MVKIDLAKAEREFAKTMRQYIQLSKKETAEALNKKAKDVLRGNRDGGFQGVMALTPKADAAKIEADLRRDGLVYWKLVKKRGLKRAAIEKKAEQIIKARIRGIGYIRAGWFKAARRFGAKGGKTRKGWASAGYGVKAKPNKTEALFVNKATGAVQVSGPALARAIESVRQDMMKYIARKLKEKWGKRR
jgi:hypothetical protein